MDDTFPVESCYNNYGDPVYMYRVKSRYSHISTLDRVGTVFMNDLLM